MSMHKLPLSRLEEEGLKAHGLSIETPSQLSDAFRQGIAWALSQQAEPAPAQDEREGWKLVPPEPTPEMMAAYFTGKALPQSGESKGSSILRAIERFKIDYFAMLAAAPCRKSTTSTLPNNSMAPLRGISMNEQQAYLLNQNHAFRCGFQDYRDGKQFDERMNDEWQHGWCWARCQGVPRLSAQETNKI